MKKLFRVMYRYKDDVTLREHYTFAKSKEQAITLTNEIFPNIVIVDCYQFN